MVEEPNSPEALALLGTIETEIAASEAAQARQEFCEWLDDVYAGLFVGWFFGGLAIGGAFVFRGVGLAVGGASWIALWAAATSGRLRRTGSRKALPADAASQRSLKRVAFAVSASFWAAGVGIAAPLAYIALVPCEPPPLVIVLSSKASAHVDVEITVWNATDSMFFRQTFGLEPRTVVVTDSLVGIRGAYRVHAAVDGNRSADDVSRVDCDTISRPWITIYDTGVVIEHLHADF